MSYPDGVVPTLERVHPTPIYEIILYLAIFAVLWRLRKLPRRPWWLFGVFLILGGGERFGIEFLRTNPPLWLGLTEAQLVSVVLTIAGIAVVWYQERRRARS